MKKTTKILTILAIFALFAQFMPVFAANENPAPFQSTEDKIVNLFNKARTEMGMDELEQNENLTKAARIKAEEMAKKQSTAPEFPEGIKKFLKNNSAEAQTHNYYSSIGKKTATEVINGWKKNVNFDRDAWAKEKATQIGVGAAKASDGTMYYICIVIKPFGDAEKTALENEVIKLVNAERKKQGLPTLTKNDDLMSVARMKANDMSENGYCDHKSPKYGSPENMVNKYTKDIIYSGEVVAAGQQTAKEVFTAWKESTAHNAIIMKKSANIVGIGVSMNDKGHLVWSLIVAK